MYARCARWMPALILLVNGDKKELHQIESVLVAGGYLVAAVSSWRDAVKVLSSVIPDLLIASTRLGDFAGGAGLQLVAASRRDHPTLPVIITHRSQDRGLENQSEMPRHGIHRQPAREFRVSRMRNDIARRAPAASRHGPAVAPQAGGLRPRTRRRLARPAHRRQLRRAQTEAGWLRRLSSGGLRGGASHGRRQFKTRRVWRSRASGTQASWWGMALVDVSPGLAESWRQFVDSIPETPPGVD